MEYSIDDLEEITRLASLNLSIQKIALYLQIDHVQFQDDIEQHSPEAASAYQKGLVQYEIDMLEQAKGSPKAAENLSKRERENAYKNAITELYDLNFKKKGRKSFGENLLDYSSDEILNYKQTGESSVITTEDQIKIDQMSYAAQLYSYNQSMNYCSIKLRQQFPEISRRKSIQILYDSIEFFHLNNTVNSRAWENFFLQEELPKLKSLALIKGDVDLAFKITQEMMKTIIKYDDTSIPEELLQQRTVLVSPEFSLDRLGVETMSLNDIMKEGAEIIDDFEISESDKERMTSELSKELDINIETIE